ncbi:14260_t:CDS:2 [Ambispora leptoticha]|uniref:14260_t:CDS:1 n=1 Tax=Ambispora leptoticha TaxID=144679 RepID=A0A9N9BJW7_9GLOM|nr:14260_t:CDS:2 [Ambispora leptoticha]
MCALQLVTAKYISESAETASLGNLASFAYFHALSYTKIRIYYQEENLRNQVLISSLVNHHIKARNERRLVRQRARQQLHEEIIATTGLLTAIAKSIELRQYFQKSRKSKNSKYMYNNNLDHLLYDVTSIKMQSLDDDKDLLKLVLISNWLKRHITSEEDEMKINFQLGYGFGCFFNFFATGAVSSLSIAEKRHEEWSRIEGTLL